MCDWECFYLEASVYKVSRQEANCGPTGHNCYNLVASHSVGLTLHWETLTNLVMGLFVTNNIELLVLKLKTPVLEDKKSFLLKYAAKKRLVT